MKKSRKTATSHASKSSPAAPSTPSAPPKLSVQSYKLVAAFLLVLAVAVALAAFGVYQLRLSLGGLRLQMFEGLFGVVALLISGGLVIVGVTLVRCSLHDARGDSLQVTALFARMRGQLKVWQHLAMAALAALMALAVLFPEGIPLG
jgi:hypothetical protein